MDKLAVINRKIERYQKDIDNYVDDARSDVKRLSRYESNQGESTAFMYEIQSAIQKLENAISCYKTMRTRQNELLNIKNMLENG